MMKNRAFILFLLGFSILFGFSCDKDDDKDDKIESNNTLVEFKFDQENDLNNWSFYSNDSAVLLIDLQEKVEGTGSLNIHKGCSSIINQDGIPVAKNANYQINLHVKYEEMPEGSYCGGAYKLALVVIQGTENEWFSISQDENGWYEKELYYHADDTGLPIQLRIYCGVQDLWIDHLVIEKE